MSYGVHAIVEGHGEVRAVPVLLRRFAYELYGRHDVEILPPHRLTRGEILSSHALSKALLLARTKLARFENRFLIVMLDADDDCPAQLNSQIVTKCAELIAHILAVCIVPTREYESWFLANAERMIGQPRIRSTFARIEGVEEIRDAKKRFEREVLVPGEAYRETVDQPRFSQYIDLQDDRGCRSLRKLLAAMRSMFGDPT